jgi:hypothetical protein
MRHSDRVRGCSLLLLCAVCRCTQSTRQQMTIPVSSGTVFFLEEKRKAKD